MTTKYTAIITALILSFTISSSAQTLINNKELLKNELDSTLQAQNLPLNSITLSPAGDWIILFGDIGFSFVRTAAPIEEALKEANQEKAYLKDIDFYENAGWSLLTKHNAYTGDKIPEHIRKKLQQINQEKKTIKCLDFNQSGAGFILYGLNSYYGKDLPASFENKLKELQRRKQRIKYAALNDDNSWVILYAKYGISYYGTNEALNTKMKQLAQQKKEHQRIFLLGNYWLLTSENAQIHTNL